MSVPLNSVAAGEAFQGLKWFGRAKPRLEPYRRVLAAEPEGPPISGPFKE